MLAWLVEALIASTGLMLLVLLLREPVRRSFGAHVAYALWLLPVLRMILPPLGALFPEAAHVNAVTQASGALGDMVRDRILVEMTGPAAAAAPAVLAPVDTTQSIWPMLLVGAWAIGLVLFGIGQLIAYRRFRRFILSEATLQDEIEPGIFLLTSARVKGPMAFGLQRRVIVFPVDADTRFDEEERAMALAHELAHHVRGDLIANAVALVMLCLHWCNPVAWIAYRAFRNDQEIACDADVIDAVRGSHLGHAYGRALVKTASGREYAVACNLTTVDRLKRRLAMLSSKSLSVRRRRFGFALAGAVVLSGLALTASGEGFAAQVGADVSDTVNAKINERMTRILSRQSAEADQAAKAADIAAARQDAAARHADRQARRADLAAGRVPPAPPAPPSVSAIAVPPVPPVPPMPPVAAVPPAPPVPPMPPMPSKRYHDAPLDAARLAQINARVPIVEVKQGSGCSATDQPVRSSEQSVMIDGQLRKKISITICGKDMAKVARTRALEGMKLARADLESHRMDADQAQKMADHARAHAEKARETAMADLDRQIARMQAEQ
jgi:beta-lactamase regulating signal transducer with metallopeptidase domain